MLTLTATAFVYANLRHFSILFSAGAANAVTVTVTVVQFNLSIIAFITSLQESFADVIFQKWKKNLRTVAVECKFCNRSGTDSSKVASESLL